MFIKVTSLTEGTLLVNTDKIYCVVECEGEVRIIYTDGKSWRIKGSIDEIERMLKGADDD